MHDSKIDIKTQFNPDYVRIEVHGERTPRKVAGELMELWPPIFEELQKRRISKILMVA